MIILSNHLSNYMPLPAGAVVRVNLAWFQSKADAQLVLMPLENDVYLDFPQGRTKPPRPTISLDDAIALANDHQNVKYFAVSNIESALPILGIQKLLREGIEVVPKIETRTGVYKLTDIVEKAKVKYAMLDKEDLYVDLKNTTHDFNSMVDVVRKKAKEAGITLLELQGVVFA